MVILGVSGSLRRGSHNTALLRVAARVLPPGVDLVRFDGLAEIPPFERITRTSPRRRRFAGCETRSAGGRPADRDAGIQRVDPRTAQERTRLGLPAIRNERLRGKPVAVIGASTGPFGAAWAQAELRKVLRTIGARVVEANWR